MDRPQGNGRYEKSIVQWRHFKVGGTDWPVGEGRGYLRSHPTDR